LDANPFVVAVNHLLMMIPLFPLGTTLFPDGLLPLKIFELRYLEMTRQAFEQSTPFGIVSLEQGSEVRVPEQEVRLSPMGVMAHVIDFEQIEPSLYFIRCQGGKRFQIKSSQKQNNGLWMADVQELQADEPTALPSELEEAANKLGRVIVSFQNHGVKARDMPFSQPYRLDDCGWVANRWCEMLPLNVSQKQHLLGQMNPRLRLDLVSEILEGLQISIQFPNE
jgi:Lon protease-like protein